MSRGAAAAGSRTDRKADFSSLLVAPIGVAVIVLSQWTEGLSIRSLLHGTAALIVFGGTLGAVLISYSPREVMAACRAAGRAFLVGEGDTQALATTLVGLAIRAHRRGIMSLEAEVDSLADSFLRDAMALVVDNTPADAVQEFLSAERAARAADDEMPARVFEAAAGYAPTLGILGAVLGLIRVMENLGAPATLGAGIAVAFVATAYGVGVANLIFLPLAGRLRERAELDARRRDLIAQAVAAIQKRANPRLVAQNLRAFAGTLPRFEEIAARQAPRLSRPPQVPA